MLAAVPTLRSLSEVWATVDYQSHGFLVPLVSLWAAARLRSRLPRSAPTPDRRGVVALAAALVGMLLGSAAGLLSLQGLALVLAVAALVMAIGGGAWLSVLRFPVAYLVFMVPVPEVWLTPVVVRLQLFVSEAGVLIARAAGMPVLREGNVIELPGGVELFVAEACSGITSVVTLLPIGVFLAWATLGGRLQRGLLVAAVLPLALLGNLVRVVATIWLARHHGVEVATSGALHDSTGLLTYGLGCGVLLAVGEGIRRWVPEKKAAL